jgi:hypothetical protein
MARFETTISLMPTVAVVVPPDANVGVGVVSAELSRDGSVVSGGYIAAFKVHPRFGPIYGAAPLLHWFRWSGSDFEDLGLPAEDIAGVPAALDCTGDTIAGNLSTSVPSTDFAGEWTLVQTALARWTRAGGFETLPPASAAVPTDESFAAVNAITADGTTVLGYYVDYVNGRQFTERWVGTRPAEVLPASSSFVPGFDADGHVRYGSSPNGAAVWVGDAPPVYVTAPDAQFITLTGLSAEGVYVVGTDNEVDGGKKGFIWSASTGMQSLGEVEPSAVSRDGRVVVGTRAGAATDTDFVWDRAHGVRSLRTILTTAGLSINAGWTIQSVSGVSDDGRVLVGILQNRSTMPYQLAAFRAVVPANAFE